MLYQYGKLRETYDRIEAESPELKKHIDAMYDAVNDYCRENGITLAYDNRAERMVEAIAKYIEESNDR